jgi:hypothetical protein
MKYLLLLLLVGCEVQSDSYTKTELNRVESEVKQFCSCRGGLDTFIFTGNVLVFKCNNGPHGKVTGDIGNIRIIGCSK